MAVTLDDTRKMIGHVDVFLEFEPIVKLVCHCASCRFNLVNCANSPDRQMLACNLKQITIDIDGSCREYAKADE